MFDNRFCILRGNRSGVFFARVESLEGQQAVITDCRRLWYWAGAASISQIATEGVKNPKDCRFTVTVPVMVLTDVIEILPCSDAAAENIQAVPVWKMR